MSSAFSNNQLEELLNEIINCQENNQMPDKSKVQNFSRLARSLPMYAEESWLAEAEDFAHLADQLLLAVKNDQFEEAVQIMDSIKEAKAFFPEH